MKIFNLARYCLFLFLPSICSAGEPSKGTVIMISGVSGWLLISSGCLLWKEIRRDRRNK